MFLNNYDDQKQVQKYLTCCKGIKDIKPIAIFRE